MLDFSGKRVLITGAASGVGRAMVELFAELGASIVAFDVDAEALDALGDLAATETVDLTDADATRSAIAKALENGPPFDAVLSNLGWTRAETLSMITDATWEHELHLNLTSAATLTRALLPSLSAHAQAAPGGTAIVYTSSVNARAHHGNPAYSAAKAGLEAFMRAIATEEGSAGVRANAVVPGSIRTAAWDHRFAKDPALGEKIAALYPLGRMVDAREVAMAAAFLASPLASGITGVSLPVDGGLSASNLAFLNAIAPK